MTRATKIIIGALSFLAMNAIVFGAVFLVDESKRSVPLVNEPPQESGLSKSVQAFASVFSGREEQFFANNASTSAFVGINQPAAQEANGKTFIAYSGPEFDPYISVYDNASKEWSGPFRVADNPLEYDTHGAPSILIDRSGYIHVFYGSHASPQKYARSQRPYDASSFDILADIAPKATYPQPVELSDGTIEVFFRAGAHTDDWVSVKTQDAGAHWTTPVSILDGVYPTNAFYAMFTKGAHDSIHVGFVWKDDTTSIQDPIEPIRRYNVYYMKREGSAWMNSANQSLLIPLNKANADAMTRVVDSQGRFTQVPWIAIDDLNLPHMLFSEGAINEDQAQFDFKMASLGKDGHWNVRDLPASANHSFDSYALDVSSHDTMSAYLVSQEVEVSPRTNLRGGLMEQWTTSNNGLTWDGPKFVNTNVAPLNDPQIVVNGNKNARVVFCEYNSDIALYNNKVFLFGEDGFATRHSSFFDGSSDGNVKVDQKQIDAVLAKSNDLSYASWDWQEGVALAGIANYAKAEHDEKAFANVLEKYQQLQKLRPQKPQNVLYVNQALLGLTALSLYEQTGNEAYFEQAKVLATALTNWKAQAQNGAFLHYYSSYCEQCDKKEWVWVDTTYMTIPFLSKMYAVTKDESYLRLASNQALLHAELLQDPETGLIHHAWRQGVGTTDVPYWGRGNGWMAASLADLLEVMPSSFPDRPKVEAAFKKQASALKQHQGYSGMWHTVVDHSETYTETSATELIGYAFIKGARIGVLDSSFRDAGYAAYEAVVKHTNDQGEVFDVSEGTSPDVTVRYYNERAQSEPQLYGQGGYFLITAEWIRDHL